MRALHLWCAVLLASGHAFAAAAAGHAPLGFEDARHLLNRTSFAAGADDIALFATLSREQAADRLLGWTAQARVTPPPEWVGEFKSARGLRQMSEEDRRAFRRDQVLKGLELRGWWLTEMLTTPSPLTEKMTLFWHNHFTSSQQKVRSPVLLYRQNALLRRYALGDFGTLLHAVARDPAMLVYLDGATSRRGQPNENFAREVMELFTLGEGHYTEQDIKEAARAFTGWSVDPETGAFLLRPLAHDDGSKTIFGRSGNFDGDGVIDLLLARPETAERIVDKLWREFVSPTPDAREVSRVARLFRENQYDTRVALRSLLTSDAFYAPENRAALIKSPVELVVGTLRQFRFQTGDAAPFALVTRQLGQDLFGPPNVKGWPGGETWINASSLLARKQFLERLFRARETGAPAMAAGEGGLGMQARLARSLSDIRFDADQWLAPYTAEPGRMLQVVLAEPPVKPPPAGMQGLDLVRSLVLDPVYELK